MFFAGIFIFCIIAIHTYATSKDEIPPIDKRHPENMKILEQHDYDFYIGKPEAPVKIVFYGDFSCHHCMRFVKDHFQKIRDDYVFTGQAQFIFRPVITMKKSLYASLFLFCKKRDDFENAKIFFEMFDNKWMMKNDYLNALLHLVKKYNWDTPDEFRKCVSSKQIEKQLYKMHKETIEALNIHETPHIFVNNMPVSSEGNSIYYLIEKEYKRLKQH